MMEPIHASSSNHQQCQDCIFQERYPLSCNAILSASQFTGSCCSLSNAMDGKACMLQVSNGWCHVEGPYWSLTRNSTSPMIECPPSDYKVPYRQVFLQQADDDDHHPSPAPTIQVMEDINSTTFRRSASAISLLFSIGIATNFTSLSILESI